jgi:hypothetical protein
MAIRPIGVDSGSSVPLAALAYHPSGRDQTGGHPPVAQRAIIAVRKCKLRLAHRTEHPDQADRYPHDTRMHRQWRTCRMKSPISALNLDWENRSALRRHAWPENREPSISKRSTASEIAAAS